MSGSVCPHRGLYWQAEENPDIDVAERGLLPQDMRVEKYKIIQNCSGVITEPLPDERSSHSPRAYLVIASFGFNQTFLVRLLSLFLFWSLHTRERLFAHTTFLDGQSCHILIYHTNWTGTSFTKTDLSAELDKSPHNTDCSALQTSKRSQSWTIRHPKWSVWQTKTPEPSWQAKHQPLPNKMVKKAQVVKQWDNLKLLPKLWR